MQTDNRRVKLPVMVIAATPDGFDGAITDDNQKAGRIDVHVTLAAPLGPPPAAGSVVDVTGVFTDYSPAPFRFTLSEKPAPTS
jgi:hypothetical protein